MTWVAVGIAGTTAAVGAVNAGAQRKAQQKANEQNANIAAAQQEFSPWTGMKPASPVMGSNYGPGALGGAVQGGLGGAMFGQQLKSAAAGASPAETPAPTPIESMPQTSTQQNEMAGMGMSEQERRKRMLAGIA